MEKNVKEIENIVDREDALNRLDAKIEDIQSGKSEKDRPWISFKEVQILIDEMFEFNKDSWLDDSSLIKKSSSWQSHRDVFDNNIDFKPSDGEEREAGQNKGRKYHIEYFRAIVNYRFSKLRDHYLDNSIEIFNPFYGRIMKISKRENELREKLSTDYENARDEMMKDIVWKFAQRHMNLVQLEKDLHQKIVNGEKMDKRSSKRLETIDYHK